LLKQDHYKEIESSAIPDNDKDTYQLKRYWRNHYVCMWSILQQY